jgi:hypothetical protein
LLFQVPDWKDVCFGGDYRSNFTILGDGIILSQPSGIATLKDTQHSLNLNQTVVNAAIAQEGVYVQIEDFSRLKEVKLEARRHYIDYLIHRTRLWGLDQNP